MKKLLIAGTILGLSSAFAVTQGDGVRSLAEEHVRALTESNGLCVQHLESRVVLKRGGKLEHLSGGEAKALCRKIERKGRILHLEILELRENGKGVKALVSYKVFTPKTGYTEDVVEEIELVRNGRGWYVVLPGEKL
ncbi:hypothetical protein [Hydrogenivirga sp.]